MAGPEDFWKSFGDDSDFEEIVCDDSKNIAYEVFIQYGIQCNSQEGGGLKNIDLKRMDAIQVIKLSLLEQTAQTGVIYEPVMNSDGVVEFIGVGEDVGLSGEDIYYELQTSSYRERCGGVMVTGGRPLAYRRPLTWHPIWQNGPHEIFDTNYLVNDCVAMSGDFSQQATIVFTDPHLDSRYEDGIDNLYEITKDNPHDSIVGYAKFLNWNGYATSPDTTISRQSNSTILVKLDLSGGLGTLHRRPTYKAGENPSCWEGTGDTPTFDTGVRVEIPTDFRFESVRNTRVDKFQGISDVYVVGRDIKALWGVAPSDADSMLQDPEPGNANPWVSIESSIEEVFRLSRGTHYIVSYDSLENDKQPYIIFADNSRPTDPIGINGTEPTTFFIHPDCGYATSGETKGETTGIGLILPTSETGGVLVSEVYVTLLLDTPSIVVYNPDGRNNKAYSIAEKLEYLVAPIIVVEEPTPVAFNGTLIDPTQSKQDHDPTTAQDFSDTDYEKALDLMEGNGTSLSLSFLDSDGCRKLSESLFDYLNSGDGTEATYVCGPGADVRIGGTAPNGGIVNSITYSYQDSNSYTISVNAGPTVVGGFAQIDGGPAPKSTEEFSAKGTILQDMGNHIYYKVRIDEIGDRYAVNMAPTVLRVGDKVQCSIHNNPVEA